jgi:hypothetical protein
MIALKNNLPLIEDTEGIAVSFESGWLRAALERAAEKAGYQGWWPAEHLAQSVAFYLENCYDKNIIAGRQLERAVQSALREIGYEEVAHFFGSNPAPRRVSLLHCLQNPSTEEHSDGFFARLAARIESFRQAEISRFHFCDLQACVRWLRENGEAESVEAELALHERIVNFVREQIKALNWNREVQCSIS